MYWYAIVVGSDHQQLSYFWGITSGMQTAIVY